MRVRHWIGLVLLWTPLAGAAVGQTIDQMRTEQIALLQDYTLDAILPSGLVRDSLVLDGNSFHPATPDAAGFALLALSAFDHLGTLADAEERVIDILRAHAGHKPGVVPDRSADGHFIHFMNIATGAPAGGGWDASFSPISTALLVSGAQFAARHFADNATIASLAEELTASVDFNAAIRADGRIWLDMTKQGGGSGGAVRPWNEFMLVESLALREENNDRAHSVKHLWLNPDNIMKTYYAGQAMLTDGGFPPAFWVHQMHFFNGDFRHRAEFEHFMQTHQLADQAYASLALDEEFRYGLTAGVVPNGYHADRIGNHPGTVFSPEAVAAWGDLDTLLEFYADQLPQSDPRYRYGMVRVSAEQPAWVPFDAGLVDHLFLLFGLVESIHPDFFAERVMPPLLAGDYDEDGTVGASDYIIWRNSVGSLADLHADGNLNGQVEIGDYEVWRANFGATSAAAGASMQAAVPEPPSLAAACVLLGWGIAVIRRPRSVRSRRSSNCLLP